MKAIFLDIDGVLATSLEFCMNFTKFKKKNAWAQKLGVSYPFNKECVAILNDILNVSDAQIILSSDWRHYYILEEIHQIFKYNGITQRPVDFTPELSDLFHSSRLCLIREEEIRCYLLDHPEIEKAVVLDDLTLDFWDLEKVVYFQTRLSEGLKITNLKEKIIKALM